MSKHSSFTSNGGERKRPTDEDEWNAKKEKVDCAEAITEDTNDFMEEASANTTNQGKPVVNMSAEEFFEHLLSDVPKGSKKKTLNSIMKALLQFKDTISDEEDEDEPALKLSTTAPEIAIQNPIVLPIPEMASRILPANSPLTITRSPTLLLNSYSPVGIPSGSNVTVSFSPAVSATMSLEQSNLLSPNKFSMSALDACPPLNANVLRQTPLTTQSLPALSLPTVQALPSTAAVNHHELLRVQQLRQQEKVKMAPPQTMSPLDVSIQQKERAFHQTALQQSMGAPVTPHDPDVLLCENLKLKILESINSNHNGKASKEEIQRYLRQNFFMILENNQYIYVPNPWQHKPSFVRLFMQQAQQQQQPQSSQMMLPPRPPPQPQVRSVSQLQTPIPQVGQLHQIQQIQNMQNVINSQIVGAEVSTLPLAQQSVQQVQQQIQSWPTSQNVLMNTLQPNILSTSTGIQILNSPKAGSKRR